MARLQDYPSVTPNTANDSLLIVQSAGQGNAKIDTVGQKIATDTTHSGLTTTSKKLVGAINELNSGKVDKTTLANLITLASKSGSIASFSTDIADKLFSCYVNVTAKQAGSGTPSPSNVRAISGWSACNLYKTGKNIFSYTLPIHNGYWLNGGYTGADEIVSISQATGWQNIRIPVIEGQKITISGMQEQGGTACEWLKSDNAFDMLSVAFNSGSKNTTVTVPTGAKYLGLCFYNLASNAVNFPNAQAEFSASATSFEKFGTTHNIPFNQTVYGSVLDVLSGVLKVNRRLVTLVGSTEATYSPNGTTATTSNAIVTISGKANGINNFITSKFAVGSQALYGVTGRANSGNIEFYLPTNVAQTADAIKAWFANNNTQVCYELATPTTIQLTPTEVKTILGQNNIFGDCGDIDLKYLETIGNLSA